MKYHITDKETAQALSATEATDRGCSGTTVYWWPVIVSPDGTQAAVVMQDDEGAGLDTVDALPEGWIKATEL